MATLSKNDPCDVRCFLFASDQPVFTVGDRVSDLTNIDQLG